MEGRSSISIPSEIIEEKTSLEDIPYLTEHGLLSTKGGNHRHEIDGDGANYSCTLVLSRGQQRVTEPPHSNGCYSKLATL